MATWALKAAVNFLLFAFIIPRLKLIVFQLNPWSEFWGVLYVGSNYFNTLGVKLKSGRDFNSTNDYDKGNSIIVNEAAVKYLQLKDPLNENVAFRQVIGVVEDFPIRSAYDIIKPMIFFPLKDFRYFILVKYKGKYSDINKYISMSQLELVPYSEVDLKGFSSIVADVYNKEQKLKQIIQIFTLLALLIGIFGLVGVVLFNLQKRRKEITIRIVLGGSIVNVLSLILNEFILAILISNIALYPLIWLLMYNWLEQFSYHIKLSVSNFIFGTIFTFIITLTVIVSLLYRHFKLNPIKYLNMGSI